MGHHRSMCSQFQPCRDNVLARIGGQAGKPIEATTSALEMACSYVVHEAASAVPDRARLSRREIASLGGREFE